MATIALAAAPTLVEHPQGQTANVGSSATFIVTANQAADVQWQRDGLNLTGATGTSLVITDARPAKTGLYRAVVANASGSMVSAPAILGVRTSNKVVGTGVEISSNVAHPSGYVFDQILATGPALALTADSGQVSRLAYVDVDDDIVQIEFSGPGTLSVALDSPSGPAAPIKYNQLVSYMKGHAGLVITGATEATTIAISAVGRANTFDPTGRFNILLPISGTNNPANNGSALFTGHASTPYDGIADIAYLAIASANGKFGAVKTGGANYFASHGLTGIFAPGVEFLEPVLVGDISAFDAATPVLVVGSADNIEISGGDLHQDNSKPVWATGFTIASAVQFTPGQDAHGNVLRAQSPQATWSASYDAETKLAAVITGFSPVSAQVGALITITGEHFVDVSAVQFGGSSASFTVVSPTRITATVPSGASTGKVSVRTPIGTARSDEAFIVEPPSTPPAITQHPMSSAAPIGASVTLSAAAAGWPAPSYQWKRNGVDVSGANSSSLTLANLQPSDAGVYEVVATNSMGSVRSDEAAVGIVSSAKVEGSGFQLDPDVHHANGNIYDQILLTGSAATITADPAQITRVSFIDLDHDIVQIEFSGAGTLTLTLEHSSPPAAPINYNQPGVLYMKGHASIVLTGVNETSHVSVFSVGRKNAINQSLFKDDVSYDGIADIGAISIASSNGKFGGIRTANAHYHNGSGHTGIYAPGVMVEGPVYVGDLTAANDAAALLLFGAAAEVRITGGSLLQLNQRAVQVDGIMKLQFAEGMTSHGTLLPAQTNAAVFERNGVDVTALLVP